MFFSYKSLMKKYNKLLEDNVMLKSTLAKALTDKGIPEKCLECIITDILEDRDDHSICEVRKQVSVLSMV